MKAAHRFKTSFEDPYLVAKFQNFFGVSYDGTTPGNGLLPEEIPINPIPVDGPLPGDGVPKKPVARKRSTPGLNNGTQLEDSTNVENGSVIQPNKESKDYTTRNKFWYILFFFGTYLGDDVGYAVFLPFWFWNVDGGVTRKMVLVWTIIMYVGQTMKDIVKWPRPKCPPVVRLQKKWAMEYGMPSTHAMVGVAFPTSILYFSSHIPFPIGYGILIAVLWCTLISLSRLYLGMHSVLDVLAGLLLSVLLLIPLLPTINSVDKVLLDNKWSPAVLIVVSLILLYIYPGGSTWTPTKGDTCIILSTCVGIQTGWWFNYHIMSPQFSPGEDLEWWTIGKGSLRMLVGLLGIVMSILLFKLLFKTTDKILEKLGCSVKSEHETPRIPFLDLLYKYLTYSISAFHVVCSLPALFQFLSIERPSYYNRE